LEGVDCKFRFFFILFYFYFILVINYYYLEIDEKVNGDIEDYNCGEVWDGGKG
jgi:hypothetical protein